MVTIHFPYMISVGNRKCLIIMINFNQVIPFLSMYEIIYRSIVVHNLLEGQQPSLFQTFVTSLAGLNMLNLISGTTVVWRTL